MDKRLIVSVSCANSFASDVPDVFTIVIDDDLSARIKLLANSAKELGVHAIEEFNYSGTWSGCDFFIDDNDCLNLYEVVKAIESDAARVEIPMLRVTEHAFSFTAVPKHCDDDMALFTRRIDLSILEDEEPIISI